jgi:hypothetical protein
MIRSSDRRFRLEVTERRENGVDEDGCTVFDNVLVGRTWGQIVTANTAVKENSHEGNYKDFEISHKIRVRKDLYNYRKGMYLKYGAYTYEVKYVQPMYNQPELLELGCKLVIESEADYNEL